MSSIVPPVAYSGSNPKGFKTNSDSAEILSENMSLNSISHQLGNLSTKTPLLPPESPLLSF